MTINVIMIFGNWDSKVSPGNTKPHRIMQAENFNLELKRWDY